MGQWRDAHTALQDDANAISDAAGGAFTQSVTVSFDLDDVTISIALSVDVDDLPRDQQHALDAQINRVLNKWRGKGYTSGSLYDGRTLPTPIASSPIGAPSDAVRVLARSGSRVRIVGEVIIQRPTNDRLRRVLRRRERVFEFASESKDDRV
ncbi:hypothetical protein [Burkholderia contaminans]|uniref:hypothetical protein n=1 Tax=Burkholderia contaminans TaxID=488447 RepID=UPI00115F8D14|nr:hypothetical protein [Burkholderia contaminans]